jgi:hypothetical protein
MMIYPNLGNYYSNIRSRKSSRNGNMSLGTEAVMIGSSPAKAEVKIPAAL